MKIMNMVKKFGSKDSDFASKVKDKTLGLVALGVSTLLAFSTSAKADMAVELKKITDAADAGIAVVSASVATIYVSIFGLVLLGVGISWLFGAIKKR